MDGIMVCGLDLGQAADYSALVIVQSTPTACQQNYLAPDEDTGALAPRTMQVFGPPVSHLVRWAERFPLNTSYVAIAQAVARRVHSVPCPCPLIADRTGVGRAVVDVLWRTGLQPNAVTFTSGLAARKTGPHEYSVPKADLVTALEVAAESERLKLVRKLAAAEQLTQELLTLQRRRSAAGNVTVGNWREGTHDDLVFALALAVWWAEKEVDRECRLAVRALKTRAMESLYDLSRAGRIGPDY